MKAFSVFCALLLTQIVWSQVPSKGQPLPPWQKAYLDLHHINTGRGNAAYYIFPDATTLLFDAGEIPPTDPRTFTPRNAQIKPDYSKKPYEWIAYYISQVAPEKNKPVIDYAIISHFHDDHFGAWYPGAPLSADGEYVLTGIMGVGELIPIKNLIDRGYPHYNYPYDMKSLAGKYGGGELEFDKTTTNYFQFISAQQKKGMQLATLKAGDRNQVKFNYSSTDAAPFYVQPVKCNGWIWTGNGSSVLQHFKDIDTANPRTWPDENSLSLAITINYGPFVYYTGGDNAGNVFYGDAKWRDVETPMAKAIGEVDVATMDHHGNRDAVNEFQVQTLKPQVWIGQTWSADHPGHEVLLRATSKHLYQEGRDLFCTNMLEANRHVIGPLIDRSYKSTQGHIVVRVLPGGSQFYVIILDDSSKEMLVKDVFGPYTAKKYRKTIGNK